MAGWGGATVVGTVRRAADLPEGPIAAADHVVALDGPEPAAAVRDVAPTGVDRVVEVALSDNVDLDAAVAKNGSVIAAYASRQERTTLPF